MRLRRPFPSVRLRSPLRSLTAKLTMAFLLVGVIGAGLVAGLVEMRTRTQFDQYISARDQAALVDALSSYFASHGSWQGIGATLASSQPLASYSRELTIADANGTVALAHRPFSLGQAITPDVLRSAKPISADGQVVGYVFFYGAAPPDGAQPAQGGGPPRGPSPEIAFLQQLTWASAVSATVAVLIALVLGAFLARSLTRPIRELTAATKVLARGHLDHQVVVRSNDEVGELAVSFNLMSLELAEAASARRQMTADLAHDLRTPLSILRGYTEGLGDGRLQGSAALYRTMHGEVVHLQRLVDDLRLLSLADHGALSLNRRPIDPSALLERTGLAYFGQAEEKGIGLRVEVTEELPAVDVDTDRLTQVLNNLVSNALRYTERGEIVLGARVEGERVVLDVRDTGSGIPAEDLPHVFDRFYRADPSRQRGDEDGASGLGLAIAKVIVEAHGGAISVTSTLGQGSAFSVAIPVFTPRADGVADSKREDGHPRHGKLLATLGLPRRG